MIIIPGKFLTQPQYEAQIDRGNNLSSGLVSAAVLDRPNALSDKVTGITYPVTSGALALEPSGSVLRFSGTASYVNTGFQSLGGVDLFCSAGNPWSVVIYARTISSAAAGTFIAKCGAGAGTTRQFQLYRDATAADQDPAITLRGSVNALNWDWVEAWHQYTVTWDGTTAKAYGDDSKEATLTVGAAAAESENIVFAARTGGTGFLLNGQIAYVYLYNRTITKTESSELFYNPWQVFKAPTRRILASVASTGLTGAASTQGNVASTAAITQIHALVGAAAGQSNTSSVAAVTQIYALVGANSTQANGSANGAVTQNHTLGGAASAQGNTSSGAAVAQTHVLSGSASAQGNVSSTGAISQGAAHNLAAATSSQANTSNATVITQTHILIHAPSVQDNVAAASAIVQIHILAGASSAQGNIGASGAITLPGAAISSTVERSAILRAIVARSTRFQSSKSVTVKFN